MKDRRSDAVRCEAMWTDLPEHYSVLSTPAGGLQSRLAIRNHNIVNIRTTILTRKIQLDIFLHTQLYND